MTLEERDGRTIILKPETAAEQEWIKRFENATLSLEHPRPFQPNVTVLKIEVRGEK